MASAPAPARTIGVGVVSGSARDLLDATRAALANAIERCWPGSRIGDIGSAMQHLIEARGYGVVRAFVGHGIGHAEAWLNPRRLADTLSERPAAPIQENGAGAGTHDAKERAGYEPAYPLTTGDPITNESSSRNEQGIEAPHRKRWLC
jgi:methionine aminopeptidase